jgi:hypothetical protein
MRTSYIGYNKQEHHIWKFIKNINVKSLKSIKASLAMFRMQASKNIFHIHFQLFTVL